MDDRRAREEKPVRVMVICTPQNQSEKNKGRGKSMADLDRQKEPIFLFSGPSTNTSRLSVLSASAGLSKALIRGDPITQPVVFRCSRSTGG
ncbi:hypothetical protein KQX54_015311 [Cotesia glomerata]|uniref:Uncharacterized protein n=1 Tax=Cotesia glomerata TaxID=32391 RepID=A0AAV7IT49_COTGL|nr:hypothetical protein KQX54_015311 [Cotesia glomerata]